MWARILNAALGIWLMASWSVLGFRDAAKTSSVICGALAATFAIIAMWEVTRGLRWLNLLIGVWLVISPLFLSMPRDAVINSVAAGLLIGALSLYRGRIVSRVGGGWAALFKSKEKTG